MSDRKTALVTFSLEKTKQKLRERKRKMAISFLGGDFLDMEVGVISALEEDVLAWKQILALVNGKTRTKTEEAYAAAADELWGRDGEIKIDGDAKVAPGADDGAYVQAWVWVEGDAMRKMRRRIAKEKGKVE